MGSGTEASLALWGVRNDVCCLFMWLCVACVWGEVVFTWGACKISK